VGIHCSECLKFNVAFLYACLDCGRTEGNGKKYSEGPVARLFYEALDLMSHDMYEEAAAKLSKLVEKHPRTKYAQCNLGTCLVHSGKMEEAGPAMRAAIVQELIDSKALFCTGIVFQVARTGRRLFSIFLELFL